MMKHWNIKFVSSLVAAVALLGAVGEIYANVGYNGTLQNMSDADWVAGKEGNALDFDGADDWVLSSYTNSFSTDYTWAAWIKTTGSGTIISKSPLTGQSKVRCGLGRIRSNVYNSKRWGLASCGCDRRF
jgi:hypothetical protein